MPKHQAVVDTGQHLIIYIVYTLVYQYHLNYPKRVPITFWGVGFLNQRHPAKKKKGCNNSIT